MSSLSQRGRHSPAAKWGAEGQPCAETEHLKVPPGRIDVDLLQARLVCAGPSQARRSPAAPTFTPRTLRVERERPLQVEILPALKKNQEQRRPEYIHRKNRERLLSMGWKPPSASWPVEKRPSTVHLPELPDHVKEKQVQLSGLHSPSPPKKGFAPAEQAIRAHVSGPLDIIRTVHNNPRIGFFYLSSDVPVSSPKYDAFNLKIVGYESINKADYYTISLTGVTHICHGEAELLTLERWQHEYQCHRRLQCIPLFARFRRWKAFRVWRTNVRTKSMSKCKQLLQRNLFVVNQSLRPALIDVREMCYRISDMGLCRIEVGHTYTLEEFRQAQYQQLQEVSARLKEFRELVKEVVRSACRTALLEAGFIPDSCTYDSEAPGDEQEMELLYKEAPEKMGYTEQAIKRNHCKRLTCFIRLADFMIVNTMHILVVNSISTLLNVLNDQVQCTPSKEVIQCWDVPEENSEKKSASAAPSMFVTQLMLDTYALSYEPSLDQFQTCIAEIIQCFQDTVLGLDPLVPDAFFHAFTQPIIYNKVEEKTCGDGPSMEAILEEDKHLHTIIQNITEVLEFAFDAADMYAETFERFRIYYKENESLDLYSLREQEHDVAFFGEQLERYHCEHKEALAIIQKRQIGLLLIDSTQLKAKLIPSPLRCLETINDMLPTLAKKMMDDIIAEAQKARYKLVSTPSATAEFVQSLDFLEEITDRIEVLDKQTETVSQMFELIEHYHVPTPPEDMATYATLRPSITRVRNAIDKAVGEKDGNINKFCQHLQQDITELNKEVKRVKEQAQNRLILDIGAEREKVKTLLQGIQVSINDLQAQALQFKTYQKNFKVEVTKYEALEELSAEVKLKQLLWDSMEEWESLQAGWMESMFEELDPEDLNAQVMRFVKCVTQLEKGLPPNSVVPKLKEQVESMRAKLPVISDLRNPALKPRHWDMLERVVNASLVEEPLTLAALQELNIFSFDAEIQEVSGQASGEASLESILKKVEDSWKTTEFVVLSHRESKDVFILGGTDEIQVLLDDSTINVSTVASSRYVGPIKSRVSDWQKQLGLFNHTLDEWLTCQRNWLYLESIFSAPDIQRQLPAEAKMFLQVDKSWKEIMRKVHRLPNALRAATKPGLLEVFQNNNALLDQIQKCLEAYLESKRVIFPRFYFLSNDELLEILAQTRNPQAVQPHLRKCFDAIARLEFALLPPQPAGPQGAPPEGEAEKVYSNDILAMVSPEAERVGLGKGLKARGNVEDWLGKVEEAMFSSLRRLTKASIADYQNKPRVEWVVAGHPSQVVLTVSQLMWCRDMDNCLEGDHDHFEALQEFEVINVERLNNLAALVRGQLPSLHRNIITALITVDVHARDIVTDLVKQKVDSGSNFEWQRQLRYYWDMDLDNCVARMALSQYIYGYEYLGACPRLVITPLTDRCYLCLMGALQLDLGGAPAGPAGTGKTETTKDLAKALAIQCVVFNCSDGLDYKMMGRFFSGLAQSGAWCCFDEFNRIDIEVLSVIAQQLITIRNAKAARQPSLPPHAQP
ncbi:hypothetical protein ANANG_G00312350 [Anguilla anguilla]|uniref:Dynein heavy chain 6, axonemal n=1 Tax=Anguilla anguilla TaxID=7936 RepID=A0A9D3RHP2_ANGAN|nr:hypothetical protein ANANG_G00312350 [Anguilla anguilla]